MLAIDWLGCLATAGALLLLYRGKWRPARALLALVLGEAGKALAVLFVGGPLRSITVGGAFSGLDSSAAANQILSIAGLWGAAFIAFPFGRQIRRDLLLYAVLGSGAVILLG